MPHRAWTCNVLSLYGCEFRVKSSRDEVSYNYTLESMQKLQLKTECLLKCGKMVGLIIPRDQKQLINHYS